MKKPSEPPDGGRPDDGRPLPDRLGRYKVRGWLKDGVARGEDTIGERGAALHRRVFGPERASECETAITLWRGRSSVSHPAILSVLDAGPWEDDAFVALEILAEPAQTLEAFLAAEPDPPARLRAAQELLGAASMLAATRLVLPDIAVVIDAYGQPKLPRLEDATDGDGSLDTRILEAAASLDVDPKRAARIRDAKPEDLTALGAELARDGKVTATAFASDVARGEKQLSRAARGRQMQIALVVIGIALLVVVLVALASR